MQTKKQGYTMKSRIVIVVATFAFILPMYASAQSSSDSAIRAQCFDTLKENMSETTLFSEPLQTLATTTYTDLESKFSKNYTGLSSFGIDIDRPDFEMRLYSFGRQTGYQHPPKLPLPVSTKSELWGETSKEYIVAEEYITDNNQQKHFLDCVFLEISGPDLSQITRERYLYDGPVISITKTSLDLSYKSLYEENESFDYQNKSFVFWDRLFVYPKATQNSYFSKYDVQDAYPTHKVTSFSNLDIFSRIVLTIREKNATGTPQVTYYEMDPVTKAPIKINIPTELNPISGDGINKIFKFADYYQAIENAFPEFAKRLSFRGTLQYDTFKKLLTTPSLDTESQKLLNTLLDPRGLAAYSVNKGRAEANGVTFSDPKFDAVLNQVGNADQALKDIQTRSERSKYYFSINEWKLIVLISLSSIVALLLVGYAVIRRRRRRINSVLKENEVSPEVFTKNEE